MISLSQDQRRALEALLSWYKNPGKPQFITLGGYAGTGKTTLIAILREKLFRENKDLKVAFCSYTGKAARVLRGKLNEAKTLCPQDSVSTIHSLIYSPIEDEKTQEIIGWKRKEEIQADLIIVDEASMVDEGIWADLCSYKIPIMAVGDHGQLPPIRENFNLMAKPDLKLEEIHRQARGNPIIRLSIYAREEGKIPVGIFGSNIGKLKAGEVETIEKVNDLLRGYNRETLILCGYNATRVRLNHFIRSAQEISDPLPQPGDRVICLRNNHGKGIFNGMLGTIVSLKGKNEEWYKATIEMDGEEELYKGQISRAQFNQNLAMNFTKERYRIMAGDLFDFGYALTVHKAQGSQAKRVILFEERFAKMTEDEWRRWLYTGVTRAEEELFIIGY